MSELDKIQDFIKQQFANTNSKIETIQTTLDQKISEIRTDVSEHNDRINKLEIYAATDSHRIDSLSYQLEILKQDRLRNNLRLTGLPPPAFDNIRDTIMKTFGALDLNLLPSDFIAYADRNKSSIILAFHNYAHKRYFIDELRKRNGLLIEEILQIQSDSKLFCNDQLSPYFAKIFQMAWQAKKSNQLYSASSVGGRIKVRKTETSTLISIESEAHLCEIIDNIDTTAPVETSTNNENESPHSTPLNILKPDQIVQQPIHNETVTNSNIHRQMQNNSSTSQPIQSHTRFSAPSNEHRNTHRTQQYQQMRQKQYHHNDQPKYKQSYQQQDKRRQIDLSPNQYSHNKHSKLPLNRPQSSRNYSSRRNEYY